METFSRENVTVRRALIEQIRGHGQSSYAVGRNPGRQCERGVATHIPMILLPRIPPNRSLSPPSPSPTPSTSTSTSTSTVVCLFPRLFDSDY